MFKNNYYNKNKNPIVIPKKLEKHDMKNNIKLDTNSKNYENIRNIVENNEQEKIPNTNQKNIKNKLNII